MLRVNTGEITQLLVEGHEFGAWYGPKRCCSVVDNKCLEMWKYCLCLTVPFNLKVIELVG